MPQTQHSQSANKKTKTAKSTAKQPAPQASGPESAAPVLAQRALNDPLGASSQEVLQLQRQLGNKAVQRLIQRSHLSDVQREAEVGLEGGEVGGDLQGQIDSARGGGQPLDQNVGDQMGGALGADFSGVRVHTDSNSDTLNRSLSAQAFTTGSDIFFSQGAYNPGTHSGKQLLAHELTHVVQQGAGKPNKVQTKLTVGPASDKYEEEADQVAGQVMRSIATPQKPEEVSLGSVQRSPFIQRKSNKLKQKSTYTALAKGGFKLFASSQYDKVMKAIDVYHGLGGTNYMAQLQQLVKIAAAIHEWEISHGTVDSTTNKDNKESARRGVLSTLQTTDVPQEIADVYQQAKTNGDAPDVHLLASLMDATQGNPGVRGTIEGDYATALRSFQAGGGDTTHASGSLEGEGASFLAGAGGSSLGNKVRSLRGLTDDPSEGRMDIDMLDEPISEDDSEFRQQMKRARQKLRGLVPALANMSDIEIMAIAAYTDEGGYTPMNQLLRGGNVVKGNSKKARQAQAKLRQEIHQANLMATSGLNKLPNWDGSTVYRGESVSWLGEPKQNMVVVLKSFTSTGATPQVPKSYATSKGGPTWGAVWEITGVTVQGKDISKISIVQQELGLGTGLNAGSQEDEVLLRPYTRLRIDTVTPGDGYPYHIKATAL